MQKQIAVIKCNLKNYELNHYELTLAIQNFDVRTLLGKCIDLIALFILLVKMSKVCSELCII